MNMNKTLIALAIAAALPVAAQADATLSGYVVSKYKSGNDTLVNRMDTDSRLVIDSSEVLANGMTATANFRITADAADDTDNSGTGTLSGDFGTLTMGSIDADNAFQAGDVGAVVGNTTEATASTASSVYGIHFAGSVANLSFEAQINADTGPTGAGTAAAVTNSSQFGVPMELAEGLTVGYSYASDAAELLATSTVNHSGIHEGQTAVGVSYTMGDLVLTAGKVNYKAESTTAKTDAVVSATYTVNADALTIVAQTDNSPSGDFQVDISYAVNDALTVSSEVDKDKTTSMTATYTDGDMTTIVSRTDDGSTDASVGLDYGNAALTIGRVGAVTATAVGPAVAAAHSYVSYKVSF
jgi:hypothetical protein